MACKPKGFTTWLCKGKFANLCLVFYHLEVRYNVQLLGLNSWQMTGDQTCYMKKYFTFKTNLRISDLKVTVLIQCEEWNIQFRSRSQRSYAMFKLFLGFFFFYVDLEI